MSDLPKTDTREEEWARARIRMWLLGKLSEQEEDRFDETASLSSELPYEVAEAEEALITEYIEGHLPAEESSDFDRMYVNGPEFKRAKVRIQQAIHAERIRRRIPAPAPEPRALPILPILFSRGFVTAFVALILLIGGVMLYRQSRLKSDQEQIAKEPAGEHAAGDAQDSGLMLDPTPPEGATKTVEEAPRRIVWKVAEYRMRYRIRLIPATGPGVISGLLEPRNNAVSFAIENAAALPLPWELSLLNAADDSVQSRYTVARQ